jgi:hypothetical protein
MHGKTISAFELMCLFAHGNVNASCQHPDLLMERWLMHRGFERNMSAGWKFDFDNPK